MNKVKGGQPEGSQSERDAVRRVARIIIIAALVAGYCVGFYTLVGMVH